LIVEVAERLAAGVQALKEGEPAKAATFLRDVFEDDLFAQDPDLRDLYARTCSLYAQALLWSGQPAQARRPLRIALDLLAELRDTEGTHQVKALESQVAEAITRDFEASAKRRELKAMTDRTLEDTLSTSTDPLIQADLALKWSNGALVAGRTDDAIRAARIAVELGTGLSDPRHEVLARIAWAYASSPEAQEQLELAHARADSANDFTLVGAVARAASELSILLKPPGSP
jgi:hypothetical protein